jgi:hypothetical protein
MGDKKKRHRSPLTFRMVQGPVTAGPWTVECSRDKRDWNPCVTGMDTNMATAQMKRLEGHGASIEYNEHFSKTVKIPEQKEGK